MLHKINFEGQKEDECFLVHSHKDIGLIKNEVESILKKTEIYKNKNHLKNSNDRYIFDTKLTKYILSTFNRDVPIEERREKIKFIIKSIFELNQSDIVLLIKNKLLIAQYNTNNNSK